MRAFVPIALAAGMAAATLTGAHAQEEKFITIGTAGQTGIYYVVGQSICQLINRNTAEHGFRCTAPATGGSIANLNSIAAGDMNFGTVQSDWQYHAMNGTSDFAAAGPNDKLRSVFSAHPDVVTIVARADSGIAALEDLHSRSILSRVGPVFTPGRAGASTLAAMAVPLDELEHVASVVNDFDQVNHNYEREHDFNLWFVVTAEDQAGVDAVLEEIGSRTGLEILDLPLERSYHIDLGFAL